MRHGFRNRNPGRDQAATKISKLLFRVLILEGLDEYSREFIDRISLIKYPGMADIDRSLELEKPEVRVIINRNKAADLGVDVRTVAEAGRVLSSGVSMWLNSRVVERAMTFAFD